MNQTILSEKELALIKEETNKAIAIANDIKIANIEDEARAIELLKKIKEVGQLITTKKEAITKPINEALKNARSFFSPFENQYDEAERIIKNKLIAFRAEQTKKQEIATAKIEKKVEEGKMDFKIANEKLTAIQLPKTIEAQQASVQYRTIREVVIEDESKLPREYLIPNMARIKEDALAGREIAGVKIVEKQTIAIR